MTKMENEQSGKVSIAPVMAASVDADGDAIDLMEYVHIIRRRWLLILLCIVVAGGAAAFVTFRMTKIYRATTTVRIETQAPQVLGRNVEDVVEMGTGSFWSNVEYYETQYKIIESRRIALTVVDEYALNEDSDFLQLPPDKLPVSKDDAAIRLQRMLTVEPVQDSRLVELHIDHPIPAKAQLLVNGIARAYVNKNLETMHTRTLEAVDWLGERLDKANRELVTAEKDLLNFKENKDILSISLEDRQSHITAQMQTAAQNLTQAKAKRIELQARKKAIQKVARIEDPLKISITALNQNALIQQLKQDYAKLSQDYGELSARYGDNFPKMVELKAKMERIKTDIEREVRNVINAVNAELNEAKMTEAGLGKALKDLEKQAQELAKYSGSYNELAREVANNEQVYQLLQGRSEEAKLARFLKVNNVEILDSALLPELPIKPKVPLNIALALFLGLIVGVALAIFIEVSDRTVKNQDDLEGLSIPFLGIVPSITSSSGSQYGHYAKGKKRRKPKEETFDPDEINFDNFVFERPKSQVAESMRSIRTNLQFMTADKMAKSFVITSPSPQEGKTTVAANLAIVMAQSGHRVLLIDTDMRKPRVHKAFDIKRPAKGISTMILGESTLTESAVPSRVENLDILPCGPTPPNPSELLHTAAFKDVLSLLLASYDRIIFDSPPVGVVTDASVLSTLVDGTVFVVKSAKTTIDAARHAVSIIKDIDSPILGIVLNGLDLANKKYGKYYYYYYSRYGSYYGEEDDSDSNKKSSKKKSSVSQSG